jgi:hypothetical protein
MERQDLPRVTSQSDLVTGQAAVSEGGDCILESPETKATATE